MDQSVHFISTSQTSESPDDSLDCVPHTIELLPKSHVKVADTWCVAAGLADVVIPEETNASMRQSEEFLDQLIAQERCIYGVTTGYGPLAENYVSAQKSNQLQRNLVYHLASGVGAPLDWCQARAVVFARLQALTQGLSAVSPRVTALLAASLNAGLAPVIPEKGTVGASGDLTPLSHLALALMGEGAWMDAQGPVENDAAFDRMGLPPLSLGPKEGLALVNGTSAMTGIAALNGARARQLLKLACILSLTNAEVFCGHAAAWHPLVGAARRQPGQEKIHALLWSLVEDAPRLKAYAPIPDRLPEICDVSHGQDLPQDPYSIRCVPQLLGAALDMLDVHDAIVEREMAAVTDNPLVFPEEGALIHAGNFFGQHVAFASDALLNAVTMIAVLLERQIARVTDVRQSEGLPAFLQPNKTGLNSGFMGAQVTASALVAEMRARAVPASIQSIPTNANNQDVVTMGTIAARKTADVLHDAARVLSIQALCMAQAVELRQAEPGAQPFSAATQALCAFIRTISLPLREDRPMHAEIEKAADCLLQPKIVKDIFQALPLLNRNLAQF